VIVGLASHYEGAFMLPFHNLNDHMLLL